MKNRFIVLMDLSPFSEHLLRFAYEWSRRAGAELLVVHHTSAVTPLMTPHETKTQLMDTANREAWEKLKTLRRLPCPPELPSRHLVSKKVWLPCYVPRLKNGFFQSVFLGIKGTGFGKEKFFIGSEAVQIIDSLGNLIVGLCQKMPLLLPRM
jgi:hypothetical protein